MTKLSLIEKNDLRLIIIVLVATGSFIFYIVLTDADFKSGFKSLLGFDFLTFQCQSTGHTNCLSNPNSQSCMPNYQNTGGVCVLISVHNCSTGATIGGGCATVNGNPKSSITIAPKGTNAVCTTSQIAAGYVIVNGLCTQNYCPTGSVWNGSICVQNSQPQYANNPTFGSSPSLIPSSSQPTVQQCQDGSIIPASSTCPINQSVQKCYDGSIIPITSTCPVPQAPLNSKICPDNSIVSVGANCPTTSTTSSQTFQSTVDTSQLQNQINTLQAQIQQQSQQSQSSIQLSQLQGQLATLQNQLLQQAQSKPNTPIIDTSFLSANLPIIVTFAIIALIVVVIVKVMGKKR